MRVMRSTERRESQLGAHNAVGPRTSSDLVLIGLTGVGIVVYLPVWSEIPKLLRGGPDGLIMLVPTGWMVAAMALALSWCWRGLTRRQRIVWKWMLALAFLGAPLAWLAAAIGVYEGPFIPK